MSDDATLDEFAEDVNKNTGDQTSQQQHLPEVGELPSDWNLVTVEEIADSIVGGGTPTKSNEEYWDGEVPWASVKDLNGVRLAETEDHITESGVEDSATNLVPADSIIISTRMTVGEPFLNEVDMAINQDMKGIIPDIGQANSLFAVYSLWDKDPYLKSLGRGTTVDGITTRDLSSTHLGLPTISEQRKIATVLHTVDQAIQKTEEILQRLLKIRNGLHQELFDKQAGNQTTKTIRTSSISIDIPKRWDVREMGDFVHDFTGGASLSRGDFTESGTTVLPKKCINDAGVAAVDHAERQYCSEDTRKKNQNNIVDSGYLITSLRDLNTDAPSIGRIVKIDENSGYPDDERYLLAQGVYGLKTSSNIIDDYLIELSNSDWYRRYVKSISVGSTQIHIRNGEFLRMKIPIPPREEQRKIAMRLRSIVRLQFKQEDCIKQFQHLKHGLMQDLLSGEVRTTDADIYIPEEVAKYG